LSLDADVIVIGAGLHGCCAALELAQRRQRVLVLERRHVGRHASGTNAGGVRTLGRDAAEIPLSLAAAAMWPRLRELAGSDGGFVPCGQVKVAESEAEMARLAERAARVRDLGYTHEELIGRTALRAWLPALSTQCVGALVVRTDGAADPWLTTSAFAAQARRLGARIVENEAITALEPQQDSWCVVSSQGRYRARAVVNAAGAWAGEIAAMAGERFPIRTRASMILVTERLPPLVSPVVSTVARRLSFKQTALGTVLIGGGQQGRADLGSERAEVDMLSLAHAAEAAVALFPDMAHARIHRTWCGIEAETPDRLPVIDRSARWPNLVHVFGFSGHGFQLGPVCGSAVADLVIDGSSRLPIAPFSASRFGGEHVRPTLGSAPMPTD
jgi:sarcosine oxidase subunit beta